MKTYQTEELYPLKEKKSLKVQVSGSKSITNRALLLATLADGKSRLSGVLFSDDSRHFLDCVEKLGISVTVNEAERTVLVEGKGGEIPKKNVFLNVGSAGTAARFLTALLGVRGGSWHLDSSDQMKKRPMAPLLETLRALKAEVVCDGREGYFPFRINGNPNPKREAAVNIDFSSQFLSALLIAFGALGEEHEITVEGSHGMAYIDMTLRMMRQFGVTAEEKDKTYFLAAGQKYQALDYAVEPDVSAACYFYAMAPLLGIEVTVCGVHFDGLQGDTEFLKILERMGCRVEDREEGICVKGPADGRFSGLDVDMGSCSDQAITLAAIAPFASSPTTIRGIGHIRLQESDRIAGIVKELTRMGIVCEDLGDAIRIEPGMPKPALIETYEDHRMAMGFSLTGLRAEGIRISNPDCCRKTFENYFEVLEDCVKKLQEKD